MMYYLKLPAVFFVIVHLTNNWKIPPVNGCLILHQTAAVSIFWTALIYIFFSRSSFNFNFVFAGEYVLALITHNTICKFDSILWILRCTLAAYEYCFLPSQTFSKKK